MIKKIVSLLGLLLFSSTISAQSLPDTQIIGNSTGALITWEWTRGSGYQALGFRVYCGQQSNYYTLMQEIPDRTVRNYLALGVINGGTGQWFCRVVAYNNAGESPDGVTGVPPEPRNVRFAITK
jgi:hypothetical protein